MRTQYVLDEVGMVEYINRFYASQTFTQLTILAVDFGQATYITWGKYTGFVMSTVDLDAIVPNVLTA